MNQMKSIWKIVPIAAIVLLMGCQSGTENQKGSEGVTAGQETQATMAESMVTTLVDGYLSLKDALVATDRSEARNQAQALEASLASMSGQWADDIRTDVQMILKEDDVEQQRSHFEHLSEKVYNVVKEEGSDTPLYKQFCPMAFDNKGAFWLSNTDQVRNPYFGDVMLTCGFVQEIIE